MTPSRRTALQRARIPLAVLAVATLASLALPSRAEVFHSRESALQLAFGENSEVEGRELFLDRQQQERASDLAGSPIPSRLVRVYEGRREDALLGWVYFETHRVRTLPETLMVVLAGDGTIDSVQLLAFHEPEVYQPHERFRKQFEGRKLDSELSLRAGLQGMAGSTFTAQAVTAAVRRVLAVHQLVVQPEISAAATPASDERID